MAAVLTRTRPGADLHMGALLRDALTRHGVTSVRVDKPWSMLPSEYLVAEVPGRARVWIHAASCNGATHYDISRGELMAVAAVVTDATNTRFVYDGFSDDNARPVAQAEACAGAVAAFLGLPVAEPERERVCLHCGRGIEWVEADGQGAWYDSSNWTGCVDGGSLHAPAPFCGSCEDSGDVTLYHDSTDGVVGSRACEWPPCVERRRKAAARQAQKHTDSFVAGDGSAEYSPQICASCHWGGFTPNGEYAKGQPVYVCTADGCGHTVAHADLVHGLEGEQSLTVIDGRLYIAEPYDGPALPPF